MFCDNCGNRLEEGSKFCSNCGKGLNSNINNDSKVQINIDIDKEKIMTSLLEGKEGVINLVKNPFGGVEGTHNLWSNSYSTKLLVLVLTILYGGVWKLSDSLVNKALANKYFDSGVLEVITYTTKSLLGLNGQVSFWKVSLVFLISLGIGVGITYFICNRVLQKNKNIYELINSMLFVAVFILIAMMILNIVIYISSLLYILIALISIMFSITYLYYNMDYVINDKSKDFIAIYAATVCFVLIFYVHNLIILENNLFSLDNIFKSIFNGLMW